MNKKVVRNKCVQSFHDAKELLVVEEEKQMSFFCLHDYKPNKVLIGENLLGMVTYAIAFYCTKCNKRKLDIGWSERGAEEQLKWLKEQS